MITNESENENESESEKNGVDERENIFSTRKQNSLKKLFDLVKVGKEQKSDLKTKELELMRESLELQKEVLDLTRRQIEVESKKADNQFLILQALLKKD